MQKQTTYNLIFNVIGALIGLTVLAYVIHAAFYTNAEPPCSARYPAPTRFALQSGDGTLLSTIELQARVGLQEWGIYQNATIVADSSAPTGAALEVKLADLAESPPGLGRAANGIDFRWNVPGAATAKAACLSYSLFLPEGFAFKDGGTLPGIIGSAPEAGAEQGPDKNRFGTRPQWRRDGEGELDVATAGSGYRLVSQRGGPLSQGRWMRIEQELVLNGPGETNGLVRMWIDGELRAENTKVVLRKEKSSVISGVQADIGYHRAGANASTLRLSPFELSWR